MNDDLYIYEELHICHWCNRKFDEILDFVETGPICDECFNKIENDLFSEPADKPARVRSPEGVSNGNKKIFD